MKFPAAIKKPLREIRNFFWLQGIRIKFLWKYRTLDFFNDINIEINTSCNRRCKYCPNSMFERGLIKNEKLMEEKLFYKIINELKELDFSGRISPQFYGEPLLDERVVKLMKYAREKLPKAKLLMISNGDYLSVRKYLELVEAGIDKFVITEHGDRMGKNMRQLFSFLKKNPQKRKKISYVKFDSSTPLYNRGGLINPERVDYRPRCRLVDNPLVIDFSGNVLLCCNDYLGQIKFGNVKQEKLIDIWESERFRKIRKQLRSKKYTLDICKKCVGIEKEERSETDR